MIFPIIKGSLLCEASATKCAERISYMMQNNTSLKVSINQISSNEIVLQTRTAYIIERNSFMPKIHIILINDDKGTKIITEYSLRKGTKILIMAYCIMALAFEILLLCLWSRINDLLVLLIPLGLIVFAMTMSILGLFLSSKKVHNDLSSMFDEGERLKLVFRKAKENF